MTMRIALLLTLMMSAHASAEEALGMAEQFAALALECVHKEYPNKIAHVLQSDADVAAPRELTPAFYGCYDWHSAVHGHWLLVRLARVYPDTPLATRALNAVQKNIHPDSIGQEVVYFQGDGRESFERPYGLAWLLQLGAELRESESVEAQSIRKALEPLELAVVARLTDWLNKLSYPIRTGEHSQTAFAFGLFLDWAKIADDPGFADLVAEKSRQFYLDDTNCPLAYEPSGQDFLSPCLAEADLMRRVLDRPEYAKWLSKFLPDIPEDGSTQWLRTAEVTDRSDGKLAHLDGLNISRAWMLNGIAHGLPEDDPRRVALYATAKVQATAGLAAVTGEDYAGGHWLGSFATYLITDRGWR